MAVQSIREKGKLLKMANEILIDNPETLHSVQCEMNGKWIFRGEDYYQDDKKNLRTSIEAAFDRYNVQDVDKPNTEKDLIREFQRKLHLYANNVPVRNDITQWLALMQHYGAPTRLLDWTYSFWVAVFFAVSRKGLGEKATVWAMCNGDHYVANVLPQMDANIDNNIKEAICRDRTLTYCDKRLIDDCAIIFTMLQNNQDGFFIANPFRMNDRLTIQQGVFVISCNIRKSFKDNIELHKKLDSGLMKKYVLDINSELQRHILNNLRQMNINSAVLFPGLQGFADSLWMRAARPLTDKLAGFEQKHKLQLYTDNT